MATWLATVEFPDGNTRYAAYSTVVESLLDALYPDRHLVGEILGDGSPCYRAEPAGEPLAAFPERPRSPVDELVLVSVRCGPDEDVWSALYCPSRRLVLGPLSSHHRRHLQETFDVVLDEAGVRHLAPPGSGGNACCGRPAVGPRVPFHIATDPFGLLADGQLADEPPADDPSELDLYADWDTGTVCRTCLLGQLRP